MCPKKPKKVQEYPGLVTKGNYSDSLPIFVFFFFNCVLRKHPPIYMYLVIKGINKTTMTTLLCISTCMWATFLFFFFWQKKEVHCGVNNRQVNAINDCYGSPSRGQHVYSQLCAALTWRHFRSHYFPATDHIWLRKKGDRRYIILKKN